MQRFSFLSDNMSHTWQVSGWIQRLPAESEADGSFMASLYSSWCPETEELAIQGVGSLSVLGSRQKASGEGPRAGRRPPHRLWWLVLPGDQVVVAETTPWASRLGTSLQRAPPGHPWVLCTGPWKEAEEEETEG